MKTNSGKSRCQPAAYRGKHLTFVLLAVMLLQRPVQGQQKMDDNRGKDSESVNQPASAMSQQEIVQGACCHEKTD